MRALWFRFEHSVYFVIWNTCILNYVSRVMLQGHESAVVAMDWSVDGRCLQSVSAQHDVMYCKYLQWNAEKILLYTFECTSNERYMYIFCKECSCVILMPRKVTLFSVAL